MIADVSRQAEILKPLTTVLQSMVRQHIDPATLVEPFNRQWAETFQRLNEVTRLATHAPFQSLTQSYMASLAVNLRGIDQITSVRTLAAHYADTARWAEQSLGYGALTSWRLSLQVDSVIGNILRTWPDVAWPQSGMARELSRISQAHISLTDWVVRVDVSGSLLGEVSGRPLGLWRDQLMRLPATPIAYDLHAATVTGQAGLGLLGADLVMSGAEDEELADTAVRCVETEVLLPWEQGRLTVARDLYERLGEIDETVPELLSGAWEDLERNGPAAASKAAHCGIEAIDRTLRAAAPDDDVRKWHTASGRPASEWANQARPTRALRVKFIAQGLGDQRTVVVAQYESLASILGPLHSRLEAAKHASQGDVTTVRSLLLSAESLLTMLFLA